MFNFTKIKKETKEQIVKCLKHCKDSQAHLISELIPAVLDNARSFPRCTAAHFSSPVCHALNTHRVRSNHLWAWKCYLFFCSNLAILMPGLALSKSKTCSPATLVCGGSNSASWDFINQEDCDWSNEIQSSCRMITASSKPSSRPTLIQSQATLQR